MELITSCYNKSIHDRGGMSWLTIPICVVISMTSSCDQNANQYRQPVSSSERPASEQEIRSWLISGEGRYFNSGVDSGGPAFYSDGTYEQTGIGYVFGRYEVGPGHFCLFSPRSKIASSCRNVVVGPNGISLAALERSAK